MGTSIGEAYQKAKKKKKEKEEKALLSGQRPDLTCLAQEIESASVDKDEEERLAKDAQENKQFAEQSGALRYKAKKELERLKKIPDAEFSSENQRKIQIQKEAIAKIDSYFPDENMRAHMKFSELWAMLHDSDLENTLEVIHSMLKAIDKWGGFYKPTQEEIESAKNKNKGRFPKCSIVFNKVVRFPKREKENSPSRGQWSIRNQIKNRISKFGETEIAIMSRENNNLTEFVEEKPGRYYMHRKAGEDKETGRKHPEGHLVFNLVDLNAEKKDKKAYLVVRYEKGRGSLSWIAEKTRESKDKRLKGMPFSWLRAGIPSSDDKNPLSDKDFRLAHAIIKHVTDLVNEYVETETKDD